ncbi:MAG: hypothetical protein FWF59_00405 [Turicibacter sp.]|nr:hypothetical protein [Turicibacter sp.]
MNEFYKAFDFDWEVIRSTINGMPEDLRDEILARLISLSEQTAKKATSLFNLFFFAGTTIFLLLFSFLSRSVPLAEALMVLALPMLVFLMATMIFHARLRRLYN